MNQILSVEMPKQKKSKVRGEPRKASTRAVILFFCIFLIIFGIALVGIGVYAISNEPQPNQNIATNMPNKLNIDIIQNAGELEAEISSQDIISDVQYNWSNGETETVQGNGTNRLEIRISIPNGTNTLNIVAKDVSGNTNNYSKEYVGPQELDHIQLEETEGNKIKVILNQEQKISYVSYFYDNDAEKKIETNGSNEAEIEIETKEGEHALTIKVGFADGTVAQKRNKMYIPTVNVSTDGNNYIIKATDKIKLKSAVINFNGTESEEKLDSLTFEKTLPLQNGENKLILKVYNEQGGKVLRKIKWEKK